MKQLLVFFTFCLLVFNLKAQPKNNTVGDICFPYPVMKDIQTDLLIGDSAIAVLKITNYEVAELKNKLLLQMQEVETYKGSNNNLKIMNENLEKQVSLNESIVNTLKSDYANLSKIYKRNKIRNTILQIAGVAGGVFLGCEVIRFRNLYIKTM